MAFLVALFVCFARHGCVYGGGIRVTKRPTLTAPSKITPSGRPTSTIDKCSTKTSSLVNMSRLMRPSAHRCHFQSTQKAGPEMLHSGRGRKVLTGQLSIFAAVLWGLLFVGGHITWWPHRTTHIHQSMQMPIKITSQRKSFALETI